MRIVQSVKITNEARQTLRVPAISQVLAVADGELFVSTYPPSWPDKENKANHEREIHILLSATGEAFTTNHLPQYIGISKGKHVFILT